MNVRKVVSDLNEFTGVVASDQVRILKDYALQTSKEMRLTVFTILVLSIFNAVASAFLVLALVEAGTLSIKVPDKTYHVTPKQ